MEVGGTVPRYLMSCSGMIHDMPTRSTTQAHALYSATTSATGLHRDLVIAGQDGDVRWSGLSMMWECCRHLQKAQTLDGSGPMRLPRQLHASYGTLSVSKAPETRSLSPLHWLKV